MRRLCLVLASLALYGCATMNEHECRTANWHDIGVLDGRAGQTPLRIAEHSKACVDYGIRPQESAWNAGYRLGLQDYCRLENAIEEGLAGRRYQNVCPPNVHQPFGDLNLAAYAVFQSHNNLRSVEGQIDSLERQLRDRKTPEDQRARIRDRIYQLDRERYRLRDYLRNAEYHLDLMSNSLLRGQLWR